MLRTRLARACALALGILAAAPAFAATPFLRGLGVDETLDRDPVLAPALDRARLADAGLPVFVRLLVRQAELEDGSPGLARLDSRVDLYGRRHVPVVLTITDPPVEVGAIDAWRPRLRALAARHRGKVAAWQVGEWSGAAAKDYAYLLKFVAVQVRSIDPSAFIVQASLPAEASGWQEQFYAEDVAAYVDAVPLSAARASWEEPAAERALARLDGLVTKEDPTAILGVTGLDLGDDSRQAAERLLRWHLGHLGGRSTFTTCSGSIDAVGAALKAAAALKDIVAGEVVTLDEQASALRLTIGGQDVTSRIPHRLLYNMTTFATYLVYWRPPEGSAVAEPGATKAGAAASQGPQLDVSVHLATAGTPAVRDGVLASVAKVGESGRDEAAKTSTARVELSARPLVLDLNFGAQETYALRAEASERALPNVDEIVFKYQQAETAQAALLRNYVADARIQIHFRPSATDSGYDVSTENRFFWDRSGAEWEERSFTLNGTRWGRNRPPFPLLQPEKVLSLPLALRLNRDYVYHLDGLDRLGDRQCFVVRFDPVDETQSLYRGKVWIDAERFVRLKVQAVQTRLGVPVVSNEEVQTFEPVARVDDQPLYLFTRLDSKQILLIAGRNLLVEKQVSFSGFRVNDERFAEERQEARHGDNIMYRDTDRGLRYLVKRGAEREVSDELTTNARAIEVGTTIDPTFDYPLPIFGINYLNFNFLDRDLQFALIFGGVLAVGNVQKARIGGTKLDLSVDFFGLAVKGNDQVFDDRGERQDERLKNRPASAGVNLGYQATDFQKITVSSHAQYDQFLAASGKTSDAFVLPVSTVTLNAGVNYEYRRAGYSLLAGYSYSRRAKWEPWGYGDQYDPADRSYTKYSLGLSKDFYLSAFNKLHLNGAYYGGQREDRFSMYRFGMFDETKMRGVPSAGVRFSELALARAQYSFNLLNLYRLDLFLDQGWGRTPSSRAWDRTTGIGAEVNLRGPKSTMLKFGIGKGFLPQIYSGSGSVVIDILVLRPL